MAEDIKLVENQVINIIQMQDVLNERTTQDWVLAGQDWDCAILDECSEALGSTNWKWWKHMENDINNLRVEAIDLLHFSISKSIEAFYAESKDKDFAIKSAADLILNVYNSARHNHQIDDSKKLIEQGYPKVIKLINLYSLTQDNEKLNYHVFQLLFMLGMDMGIVFDQYALKNNLNMYRQDRGYADPNGRYTKVFSDGREDNEVFKEVYHEVLKNGPFKSAKTLSKALYCKMDMKVIELNRA